MSKAYAFFRDKSSNRIALWIGICILCLTMTIVTMVHAHSIVQDVHTLWPQPQGSGTLHLETGESLSQEFIARGRICGLWIGLHLDLEMSDAAGMVACSLTELNSGKVFFDENTDLQTLGSEEGLPLPEIYLNSGKHYRLSLVNNTDGPIEIGYNPLVQSGVLSVNAEQQTGFVNFSATRVSDYKPTPLFYAVVFVVNFVVIVASWLVLFADIKVHVLYLILTIGFGFAMMFDLTPLYGFDMRYHFDSTYVMSNILMGMEGTVETPSLEDPNTDTLSYYRRYGDDYSQFCHYHFDFVSANYTDTYRGLRSIRATQKDQEIILVQTYQDYVEETLFLYLPQAVGFTIARLLRLGFYPMLQLGRLLAYGAYVILTYLGIKQIPVGKRLMMILALMPASLIHAVSINRDAMIVAMCFYLIPKVFAVAYGEGKPTKKDWIQIMVVSIILAPSKIAYIPVSFLWLVIIYRKYMQEQNWTWKKSVSTSFFLALPIFAFFILANLDTFDVVIRAEKPSLDGTEAYTVFGMLTQPKLLLYLMVNTIRTYLGTYLINAVQLFDIGLGSGDGMTLTVFFLLLLEVFSEDNSNLKIRTEERGFTALVLLGAFFLILLASVSWTPNSSDVIQGLQGRYLIPVLPLLGFVLLGCPLMKSGKYTDLAVKLGCCIFPAIVLLNMYLWSIGSSKIDLTMIARFC